MSIGFKMGVSLVAVAGALALASCGDDDDDETAAAPTETTEETTAADGGGGGETLAVSLTDFEIDPADPTVSAGAVTFDVTNDGAAPHNLEVEGPSGESELPQDLAAGESGTLEVDLSEPGTYEWYCPVGDHADQGMVGEITVE